MSKLSSWEIQFSRFEPAQEPLRESLCTLANGYMGSRAAAPEAGASAVHYPGTYIAGLYNRLKTNISGRAVYNEDMVNCPNWLPIIFQIEDEGWFFPSTARIISYCQTLNMKRGILSRRLIFQTRKGRRTFVEYEKIVSMAHPHCGAISYRVTPLNYSGEILFRLSLDGGVLNTGVERYRQLNCKHLKFLSSGEFSPAGMYLVMCTNQSKIEIAQACRLKTFLKGKKKNVIAKVSKSKVAVYQEFKIFLKRNETFNLQKIVYIYTSRDNEVNDSALKKAIAEARNSPDFDSLKKKHVLIWKKLWQKCDIKIEEDLSSQWGLRFCLFHILSTASFHNINIDAGLPARGLSGESYRGHIFWDEVFILPFLNLHLPQVAKALLMYRYRRLKAARQLAKKEGYRGACFPWQSASSGKEETQQFHLNPLSGKWGPDYSHLQRHISFAIAYNIWHYWRTSGDDEFMINYGAEMFLSIARFAAFLAKYSRRDDRFHTKHLMGPDEFHEKIPNSSSPGLRDNAYSNIMIVWILLKAEKIISFLCSRNKKEKIFRKINLKDKEIKLWEKITYKMNIIISNKGIISQFDGYFDLKELDWHKYHLKYGKINRMDRILKAEGSSPDKYKISKQPDVLMAFYLIPFGELQAIFKRLGYSLTRKMFIKNYDYYEERTSHGSTLSMVVHCFLEQLLGRSEESLWWFQQALDADLYDIQGGTTQEGLHLGVMGGAVNIVLGGFAGLDVLGDNISLDPNLPPHWDKLSFSFCWRKKWFDVIIEQEKLRLFIHGRSKMTHPIKIKNKLYYFQEGKWSKIFFNSSSHNKSHFTARCK